MRCSVLHRAVHARRMRAESHHGFTLVELLVAISVLAIVAVMGWRGLDSIVRARTALSENLEQTRGLQLAFAQLQNDCANLTPAVNLAGRVPLQTAGRTLQLVRNVIADNQPVRIQVVMYRVRNGLLTRWASPAVRDLGELDRWLEFASNSANGNETASQEVTLQSGVAAIVLRAWNNGWRDGDNVIPADGVVATTGLEVTLKLQRSANGLRKVFLLGAT